MRTNGEPHMQIFKSSNLQILNSDEYTAGCMLPYWLLATEYCAQNRMVKHEGHDDLGTNFGIELAYWLLNTGFWFLLSTHGGQRLYRDSDTHIWGKKKRTWNMESDMAFTVQNFGLLTGFRTDGYSEQ